MNVKVTFEVTGLDELWQRMPCRGLDFAPILAQLMWYPLHAEGCKELLLGDTRDPVAAAK